MTVEIKELVIRAVVEPGADAKNAASEAELARRSPGGGERLPEQSAIVAACVREVMRRLEKSRER